MTIYLDVQDVLQVHRLVIRETGGGAGVRDGGLLESAVAQPQASFGGTELCQSLEEKAAALCYSIVMNHPFVDGNKRTGFVSADTMLRLNGFAVEVATDAGEETILKLASGNVTREHLTAWFSEHVREMTQ